jgi:hypothetical protein
MDSLGNILVFGICAILIALFSRHQSEFFSTAKGPDAGFRSLVDGHSCRRSQIYPEIVVPTSNFSLSVLIHLDEPPSSNGLHNILFFTRDRSNPKDVTKRSPSIWLKDRRIVFGVGRPQDRSIYVCDTDPTLSKGANHLLLSVRDRVADSYLNGQRMNSCVNQQEIVLGPHLHVGPLSDFEDSIEGSISVTYSDQPLSGRQVQLLYQSIQRQNPTLPKADPPEPQEEAEAEAEEEREELPHWIEESDANSSRKSRNPVSFRANPDPEITVTRVKSKQRPMRMRIINEISLGNGNPSRRSVKEISIASGSKKIGMVSDVKPMNQESEMIRLPGSLKRSQRRSKISLPGSFDLGELELEEE